MEKVFLVNAYDDTGEGAHNSRLDGSCINFLHATFALVTCVSNLCVCACTDTSALYTCVCAVCVLRACVCAYLTQMTAVIEIRLASCTHHAWHTCCNQQELRTQKATQFFFFQSHPPLKFLDTQ
jgi:hypothetical protein